jgi:hypothetical protein
MLAPLLRLETCTYLSNWRGNTETEQPVVPHGHNSLRKNLMALPSDEISNKYNVTYSGFSIHDGTLLRSKSQYTTVKHSRQLLEHTYTSDPHGLGTPTPIEFFQQDLLWQSSNTRSHSCSQKASKHARSIRRRAIGSLAHHNGTSAHSPSLACHLPAPTIECLHRPTSTRSLTHWLVRSKSRIHRNICLLLPA